MKQENIINIGGHDYSFDNYFCPYIDDCGRERISEKCWRDYEKCNTYQVRKSKAELFELEKLQKQVNLEKMILRLKERMKEE